MSFHYEVVTSPAFAALFRRKFLENMGKTRCSRMFRLTGQGMPDLWEFKGEKDLVTLSFGAESEEQERLLVESMTLDLTDIVLASIQSGLKDYLTSFLAPLAKMPLNQLEGRIRPQLESLESIIKPKTLWDTGSPG